MTHKMILMSHDYKEVKALVVAKRKSEQDCRDSLDGKISDSYPEVESSILSPGSISTEGT